MKAQHRNAWYATILTKFFTDEELTNGFFSLNGEKLYTLALLAEVMRVKSENGKSPARTLYDRAKAGLAF